MCIRMLLGAGALCIGMLAANVAAAAVNVTYNTTVPTNTGPGPAPTSVTGGTQNIDYFIDVAGSVTNVRRSPWENDIGRYHSINPRVTATYSYGAAQTFFSIMWGSPDIVDTNRNKLEFFDGNALVYTGGFRLQAQRC
jgi:hypothetical protein